MTSPSSIDSVKMVKETPAEIYLEDMPEIIVADSLQDEFFIIEHKGAEPEVIDSIKTRINKSKR